MKGMMMTAWLRRRINWKVFGQTWRMAHWDFWESKQSEAWDEPKSHFGITEWQNHNFGTFLLVWNKLIFLLVWELSLLSISNAKDKMHITALNVSFHPGGRVPWPGLHFSEHGGAVWPVFWLSHSLWRGICLFKILKLSFLSRNLLALVSSHPPSEADFEEMPNIFAKRLSPCFQPVIHRKTDLE